MENSVIKLNARAKVNLFLHAEKKDEKGYHPLKTVFQPLILADEIIISKSDERGVKLTSNANIPLDKKNNVYKAISIFCNEINKSIEELKLHIHIQKNIPISAGLGGSAVDSAPVLIKLNELLNVNLSREKLEDIARKVGADVPHALYLHATYATGYGDVIEEEFVLPSMFVSIYTPYGYIKNKVNKTAYLYNLIDQEKEKYGENLEKAVMAKLCLMKKALKSKDWKKIGGLMHNDFEFVAFKEYPILRKVKEIYLENGAYGALLAGSGGSIFGIFKNPSDSLAASNKVEQAVGRESGQIILTETTGF